VAVRINRDGEGNDDQNRCNCKADSHAVPMAARSAVVMSIIAAACGTRNYRRMRTLCVYRCVEVAVKSAKLSNVPSRYAGGLPCLIAFFNICRNSAVS
jgi:hypothetical protein